jgi:hypothetical protein
MLFLSLCVQYTSPSPPSFSTLVPLSCSSPGCWTPCRSRRQNRSVLNVVLSRNRQLRTQICLQERSPKNCKLLKLHTFSTDVWSFQFLIISCDCPFNLSSAGTGQGRELVIPKWATLRGISRDSVCKTALRNRRSMTLYCSDVTKRQFCKNLKSII